MQKHSRSSSTVKRSAVAALCAVILFGCAPPAQVIIPQTPPATPAPATAPNFSSPAPTSGTADLPPPAPREFRAAWVSTVANIDWPSRAGLPVTQQKAEIETMLDRARAMNLNAIILQVRPSADAIYPSKLEPWTEYLSGKQGEPPKPMYDPLKTWIDSAHARGIELHAWFNPYRARHSTAKSPIARDHIAARNPGVVKTYGKFLWMDPGEPAAVQQTLDVMLDVVKRYDVDGVHIDDYFYPYPIPVDASAADNGLSLANKPEIDFPDEVSWSRYLAGGGILARADWRRQNVNGLIERIYTGVHAEKPWVKVGISPFGLPRPDRRPPGIVGFSQYDKLYADAELWFNQGWVDYFTPQLYWPAAPAGQSFPVLLDYWATQNTQGRALWPGLFTSRIGDRTSRAWAPQEILGQIDSMRARSNNVSGHVHFSIAALNQDREGIASALAAKQYSSAALIPAMPWLDASLPAAPEVSLRVVGEGLRVSLKPGPGKAVARYAVWTRCGGEWKFSMVAAEVQAITVGGDARCARPSSVAVSAVDRVGNESALSVK